MPVRYDIAAQIPQASGGGFDPLNMMTQIQAMDYRQRQNALAEMQMQKLQQELQQQNVLRGALGGLDINSPEAINVLSRGGNLAEALQVQQAQRQAAALRAQEEAQRATAGYQTGMLGLAQAKLPMEQQKLGMEAEKERRLAESAKVTGEKTSLERDAEVLKNAENQAAKIFNANGKGYDTFYAGLPDPLKAILPPQYDADALDKFTTQMSTVQENLKRAHEFELVDRINPQNGLKEKVAVPKYAPEKGGKTVAGTAGIIPEKYGFMPGPENTGTVIRTSPTSGAAEIVTPVQPGAAPTNAMTAPAPAPAPAPAAGALIPSEIRPTTDAPVGSAAYNNKRFATEALDAVGFDSQTGQDRVSQLIKDSTSGGMQAGFAGLRGYLGGSTKGMEAIAGIKPIVKDIILKKLNGKLGAGISNEDRSFIESTLGNLDDPSIPAAQRLASWDSAKRILMKYANTGQPAAGAPANRPPLEEIFK